ncbi:nuclear RNA export factor 2 isoform X1 [Prionailurus iriomotensis]
MHFQVCSAKHCGHETATTTKMHPTLEKCGPYSVGLYERRQDGDRAEMQTFKPNGDGSSHQGRKKVWSSFRGNFGKRNPHDERDGYDPQLSQHQEDDETVMMRDIQEYPQVRHTPYSTRHNKRRAKWHDEDHIHITVWRDRKLLKRQMGENTQDGTPGSLAIKDCFPKLLRLDGQELSPPVTFDIDTPYLIKPCKESYKGSEILKSLVLQFLQQYYLMYDSGDHQGLLGAYHHEACFSLTIPFNPEDQAPSSLCGYCKESRNMKKLKDPRACLWVQLLKHTKRDIVCSLGMLPKTQHDLSSFVVDMWFQTEMMLCFSVNGVFKEGRSQGSVRAFTRTFIVTPASNSSICIVNDELFVREATPSETQSAFSIRVPTPTSSSMPTLSQEQQEMVQVSFSTQSGMKLEWSKKCLQDNEWNYTRAGQVFTMLKEERGQGPRGGLQTNRLEEALDVHIILVVFYPA